MEAEGTLSLGVGGFPGVSRSLTTPQVCIGR
jgi:hypothetical protein